MLRLVSAFFAVLALFAAPPAWAAIDAGEYHGQFRDKKHVIGVALTLLPARFVGDPAGRIRMGPGWGCGLDLQFTGAMGQLTNYNFTGGAFGACQAVARGFMRVHPRGHGIQIEFVAPDGRVTRKITLSKSK